MSGVKWMRRGGLVGRACWCAAAVVTTLLLTGDVSASEDALFGKDIQFQDGVFDYVKEENSVVLSKYAVVVIGDTRISARNMVYNYSTKEVYAEGDVVFEEANGSEFYCDQLFFNTMEWHGIAEGVRAKVEDKKAKLPTISFVGEGALGPTQRRASTANVAGQVRRMVVMGKQIRTIDRDHYEIIDAKVTPSLFARPHWHIASKAVVVRRNEKVESWHNVLKIGRVPVFYFPYIIKDLKYDWPWIRMAGGHTSDHGWHLFTKTGMDLDQNDKAPFRLDNIFFDIDYRQERGWAFGVETRYATGRRGMGHFSAYWLGEDSTSLADDHQRAYFDNEDVAWKNDSRWEPTYYQDKDRYKIDLEHRQEFNERWDLRVEAHKYGDRDFREEYFETEYKLDKEPETSMDLRRWDTHWQFELVATKRLNDWQSQTEYLPEARITVPGFQIGRTPLYITSDTRIGHLIRRFDTALDRYGELETAENKVKDSDSYETDRFHQRLQIDLPLHVGPFVFKPHLGAVATYYADMYGEHVDSSQLSAEALALRNEGRFHSSHVRDGDDSTWNAAMIWGADLSTRLYGSYANNTWRHIIEPTLRYRASEKADHSPEDLYYFDEVDAYDERHYFEFALNQKLQEKKAGALRNVVNFDMSVRFYPQNEEAQKYVYDADANGGYDARSFTEIEFDLVVNPTAKLQVWTNGLIDPHDAQINRFRIGGRWRWGDRLSLYGYHQYYRGHYWRAPTSDNISRTTLALRTPLWNEHSRYAGEVAITYDWDDNGSDSFDGLVEQRVTLYRDLDTFELGVSFVQDNKDDDKGVFFELRPKGWAGINRPSSVSDGASMQLPSRYGDTEMDAAYKPRPVRTAEIEAGETIGATLKEQAVVSETQEEAPDEDVLKTDPTLTPGEDDVEFEGELPTLEGAGEDPAAK